MLNNLTKKCIVKFISFSAGKYPNLKRFVTVTNSDARSRGLQGMTIKVLILIINNLIIPFPHFVWSCHGYFGATASRQNMNHGSTKLA